ncbi:MAG: hypothetical protein ABIF12_02340 [bacterium]
MIRSKYFIFLFVLFCSFQQLFNMSESQLEKQSEHSKIIYVLDKGITIDFKKTNSVLNDILSRIGLSTAMTLGENLFQQGQRAKGGGGLLAKKIKGNKDNPIIYAYTLNESGERLENDLKNLYDELLGSGKLGEILNNRGYEINWKSWGYLIQPKPRERIEPEIKYIYIPQKRGILGVGREEALLTGYSNVDSSWGSANSINSITVSDFDNTRLFISNFLDNSVNSISDLKNDNLANPHQSPWFIEITKEDTVFRYCFYQARGGEEFGTAALLRDFEYSRSQWNKDFFYVGSPSLQPNVKKALKLRNIGIRLQNIAPYVCFIAPYYNNEFYFKVISPFDLSFDGLENPCFVSDGEKLFVYSKKVENLNDVPREFLSNFNTEALGGSTFRDLLERGREEEGNNAPVYFFSDIQGQYFGQVGSHIAPFLAGERGSAAPFLAKLLNFELQRQDLRRDLNVFVNVGDFVAYASNGRDREGEEFIKCFFTMRHILNGCFLTSAMGLPHDIASPGTVVGSYDTAQPSLAFNSIFNSVLESNKIDRVVNETSNYFIRDRILYCNLPITVEPKNMFKYTEVFSNNVCGFIDVVNKKKEQREVDFIVAYSHLPLYTHYKYMHPGMINMLEKDGLYSDHMKSYNDNGLEFLNRITEKILESKIDVYISGHNHVYEHNIIEKNNDMGQIHSFIIGTGTDLRNVSYREDNEAEVMELNIDNIDNIDNNVSEIDSCKNVSIVGRNGFKGLQERLTDFNMYIEKPAPFLMQLKTRGSEAIKEAIRFGPVKELVKTISTPRPFKYLPSFLKVNSRDNGLNITFFAGDWRDDLLTQLIEMESINISGELVRSERQIPEESEERESFVD